MGAKATLKLTGVSDLLERIAQINGSVDDAADRALTAGAGVAIAGMKRRVAVDTGNLRNNIKKSNVKNDGGYFFINVGLVDADAKTAKYGTVQEFGSTTTPAHPYIRPTMDSDKSEIRNAIKLSLERVLGKLT